jgi:hypothetical protein
MNLIGVGVAFVSAVEKIYKDRHKGFQRDYGILRSQ